jgi:hypothetical protein
LFTADDPVAGYADASYGSGGNSSRWTSYYPAGADDVWFTADDTVSSYSDQTYNSSGCITREVQSDANETVTSYTEYTCNSSGEVTRVIAYTTGPDGAWFTSDDEVTYYSDYFFGVDGVELKVVTYLGSGADGTWFTGDDTVTAWMTYAYR